MCGQDQDTDAPKWSTWDVIAWKLLPERWGGGRTRLDSYKDAWITHNKEAIKRIAASNKIPAELLAGIAWEEAGGDPSWADGAIYPIRRFDWSGPDWVDKHMTVTKNPDLTSFGTVSIQLRNAASVLGLNITSMTEEQKTNLIHCLERDVCNLEVVGRHLYTLIRYDFPNADTTQLTDEQFAVVGSRYNRGTTRKLQDLLDSLNAKPGSENRDYTSYGRTMLRRRDRIRMLLAT